MIPPTSHIDEGDYIPMFVLKNRNQVLKMELIANKQFFLLFIDSNQQINLNMKYPVYKISKDDDMNIYNLFVNNNKKYNLFFIDKNLKVGKKFATDNIQDLNNIEKNINIRKNIQPPILVVPDAITPELAQQLIEYFEKNINTAHIDKRTTKSRTHMHPNSKLSDILDDKLSKSLFPEIYKVFYHDIKYRENWKICCYRGEDEGNFHAHRDTIYPYQHRRYAMSLLLNDDYEGGGIVFPEYSDEIITAPKYSAIIFPGTLYHEVKKINKGTRYVIISFLFTEKENEIKKNLMYKCKFERNLENIQHTDLVKYEC